MSKKQNDSEKKRKKSKDIATHVPSPCTKEKDFVVHKDHVNRDTFTLTFTVQTVDDYKKHNS